MTSGSCCGVVEVGTGLDGDEVEFEAEGLDGGGTEEVEAIGGTGEVVGALVKSVKVPECQ